MYLADVSDISAPPDPFKTTYNKKTQKLEVVDKVNNAPYYKPHLDEEDLTSEQIGPGVKRVHNYRWTTVEN